MKNVFIAIVIILIVVLAIALWVNRHELLLLYCQWVCRVETDPTVLEMCMSSCLKNYGGK